MGSAFFLYDQLRVIRNNISISPNMTTEPEYAEHRYEQRHQEYTLRSWGPSETSLTAAMVDRPQWLVQIIDTAVVGGHVHPVPMPPPDLIVWFRTIVGTNDLVEFIDFTNP
jgi:hypothetical protein